MTSITIIGAGFSGTMTAVHLLRKANSPLRIKLIEKTSSHTGRGTAYSATASCQLLNVPASNMSAFPDVPEDFLKWAHDHWQKYARWVTELSPSTFLPRALYGEYLSHLLRTEMDRSAAMHQVEIINDEIIDLDNDAAGINVQSRRHGSWVSDACVLALGNFPPQPPRSTTSQSATACAITSVHGLPMCCQLLPAARAAFSSGQDSPCSTR